MRAAALFIGAGLATNFISSDKLRLARDAMEVARTARQG